MTPTFPWLNGDRRRGDGRFGEPRRNRLTVNDWTEKSRYATTVHHKAKRLYNAITERTNGVMQWIKARW